MDLPIELRNIVTPYNLAANEAANMVVTSNNKASFVRRGGFHFTLDLAITPFNLTVRSQAERYWEIVGFLNKYPSFGVPIHNMIPSNMIGDSGQYHAMRVQEGPYAPGYTEGIKVNGLGARGLNPGQYIQIGLHNKLYQVIRHDMENYRIYLSQPLSATINTSDSVIHDEYTTDNLHPMLNVRFNGLWVDFINEDFGNPVNRIEDGIMGNIGPLKLREKL